MIYRFTNITHDRLSLVQYGVGQLDIGAYVDIEEKYIRPQLIQLTQGQTPQLSVSPELPYDLIRYSNIEEVISDFSKVYPYSSNPILSDSGAGPALLNPKVLYDRHKFANLLSTKYLMFVQTTGGTDALAYSTSVDGITWNTPTKITTNLPTGANYPTKPVVIFDKTKSLGSGYYFQLWYQPNSVTTPITNALKTSYSNDAINWTTPSACGDLATGIPILGSTLLIATDFNGFRTVFYNPSGTSYTPAQIAAHPRRVLSAKYVAILNLTKTNILSAVAYSNDGIEWALIYDDILLPASAPFDTHLHSEHVVKVGKYYVMFIGGGNGADNLQFGYAVSDDLATWEYKGLLRNLGRIKRYNTQSTAMEAYPTNQLAPTNSDSLSGFCAIIDPYSFDDSIFSQPYNYELFRGGASRLAAKFYWVEGNTSYAVSYGDNL